MTDTGHEEPPLVRRTRAINSLVVGVGQIILAVLVCVAAAELRVAARGFGSRGLALVAVLAAFAVYAAVRGVRQVIEGSRLARAGWPAGDRPRRDRPHSDRRDGEPPQPDDAGDAAP